MKTWLLLAAIVATLAVPSDTEAHWRYRRYRTLYGYPAYGSYYYAAPVYTVARPVVTYYPPVYQAPVVAYPPVTYSTWYAPTYYAPTYPYYYQSSFYFGW